MTTSQFRFEGPQKKRRLDVCLAEGVEDLSRSAAQRLVRAGAVSVNGEIETRPAHTILPGAEIQVERPGPEDESELIATNQSFTVIYEDEHLLVVDKPIGLTVHPGPGHNSDTLVNGLLFDFPEIRARYRTNPSDPYSPVIYRQPGSRRRHVRASRKRPGRTEPPIPPRVNPRLQTPDNRRDDATGLVTA